MVATTGSVYLCPTSRKMPSPKRSVVKTGKQRCAFTPNRTSGGEAAKRLEQTLFDPISGEQEYLIWDEMSS